MAVAVSKALEPDGELDVAGADDVLYLEVCELCLEAELLDDAGELAGSQTTGFLALSTGDNHLSRRKDERRCLRLTDTHDDCSEPLWVVLCVAGMQSDGLEVEPAIQVHRSDDISNGHCVPNMLTAGLGRCPTWKQRCSLLLPFRRLRITRTTT